MRRPNKTLDTSSELIIEKWNHGIRLIRLEALQKRTHNRESFHTVGQLFDLPFNVYFMNYENKTVNMNQASILTLQLENINWHKKTCNELQRIKNCSAPLNDNIVMKTKKMSIFEEKVIRFDGKPFKPISIKLPWFDEDNQILGVFGFAFFDEANSGGSLSNFLTTTSEMGFLNNQISLLKNKEHLLLSMAYQYKFSKRETECLQYLIRGLGIKEVASALEISPFTVRNYLETMKHKTGFRYKSQLIQKALTFME